ncbi:hypothetical protein JZ751_002063 [Albula glossodonta]|uniref:Protein phosphatase 1L n=1 Tax=Albula glossodonta TaxID=121402 RepID=A0A8T2PFR6_9TELE|nr:hypothetical protein JZ751_002063 [Albula glossodonta]
MGDLMRVWGCGHLSSRVSEGLPLDSPHPHFLLLGNGCWRALIKPLAALIDTVTKEICVFLCDLSPKGGSANINAGRAGARSAGTSGNDGETSLSRIKQQVIYLNCAPIVAALDGKTDSVFDGKSCPAAAEYVKTHLPEVLKQHLLTYEKEKENSVLSYPAILEQHILSVDKEMLEKLSASYDEAGTTCLIALLSDKELTVANVGDSRGVLCDKDGNAIALSHDHKPYQLKERKRIKRAGGFISFNGSWRVQGILAMSRSLGDYPLKNLNVIIPDPDILAFDLDKLQPEFMILASDGLWDAFSNEEAVRFIKERLDEPHFGAKSIVLQSFYRGCPDNITVMVVKFKNSNKASEQ